MHIDRDWECEENKKDKSSEEHTVIRRKKQGKRGEKKDIQTHTFIERKRERE